MAKRRKRQKKTTEEPRPAAIKPEVILSILQILLFVFAALVLVSFSRQGSALVKVNDVLTANFGWSSILLPFIATTAAFLLARSKFALSRPHVTIGALLFFVSVMTMTRAGTVGSSAWDGVAVLITGPGAFVLLLAFSIMGVIVMLNMSIDQIAKSLFKGNATDTEEQNALPAFERQTADQMKQQKKGGLFSFGNKKEMKVVNGAGNFVTNNKAAFETKETHKPVSNVEGEDQLWKYPPLDLLAEASGGKADRGDIKGNAGIIEQTLDSFGITARVIEVNLGPAVTQYAIEVALGTKLSKITALDRDLALALAAPTGAIRIEAPIPGRSLVGIELPNRSPEFVPLKKMLLSDAMRAARSKLTVALGLDVGGKPIVADIAKMPHVMIAGQTGSGKSVCLNTFLASILFRASPSEVKLILVDPKRVEMTGYNNIPHLLTPVVVEPDKVLSALRWLISEMDRRYKLFATAGVRNLDAYNEQSGFQAMPFIVLVIDELADIMLFAPVEVEDCITRLAQMSRATGIHMVLATQRPSVDVLTGLIKANVPHRIAFAVASQVDSRVILDAPGAEKLLGKGDMLHLSPEAARPRRIQGAFISDKDINKLVDFLKNQGIEPSYTEEVVSMTKSGAPAVPGMSGDADDLFQKAVEIVCQYDKASASLLQRKLSVGYARAARILDQLQEAGVVGEADGSKPREVLIQSAAQFFEKPSENSDGQLN